MFEMHDVTLQNLTTEIYLFIVMLIYLLGELFQFANPTKVV